MRTPRSGPRRAGGALAAVTLAVALVACGGEETDDAAEAAGEQETSQTEETEKAEDAGDEESGDATQVDGALSADEFFSEAITAQREAGTMAYEVTTRASGATQAMEGEAEYSGDSADSRATDDQGGEFLMVDGIFYISSPQLTQNGEFIRVDPDDPKNQQVMALLGNVSNSPADLLEAIGKPTDLKVVGTEEVAGVETLHYEVTVNGRKLMSELGGIFAQMAESVPEEITMDMWLDSENRLRKQVQELDLELMGQQMQTHTEFVITEYGHDVTIEAPPEGRISDIDLADMLSRGGGAGNGGDGGGNGGGNG